MLFKCFTVVFIASRILVSLYSIALGVQWPCFKMPCLSVSSQQNVKWYILSCTFWCRFL